MSSWRTVRVFISSTFRDMQAERDHLVRFVFPQLRQELLQWRIHLVDVDLRWGVTSDQDASEVCREVVDECHPRFLCMLGGRYGWVPDGKPRSITADEIHYGVLDREATHRGFAHFYFREENATAAMEETTLGEFREPKGSDSQKALAKLKQAIADAGLNPFTYPAKWDKQSRRLIGLAEFGQQVHDDLLRSMKDDPELRDRFTESTGKPDEFTEENAAMEAFIEERTQRFVLGSRKAVMDELLAHANSTGGNGYLCLVGEPGSGKSALLAKFFKFISEPTAHSLQSTTLVIPHFVGASAGSTDVRRTLRRLCHEIYEGCELGEDKEKQLKAVTGNDENAQKVRLNIQAEYEIPDDLEKLRTQFHCFIKKSSGKKHVMIILDAVNQFDSTTQLTGLTWLPEELPENVRIILSLAVEPRKEGQNAVGRVPPHGESATATSGDVAYNALRHRRLPPKEIELKPLTLLSAARIVQAFLHRYRKQMDRKQRRALLSKTDAVTPLYLLSALEELRTLGTYEEITDRIAQLPSETQALFTWILKRLENDDGFRDISGQKSGSELVANFASLMGVSRHGLSQQELVELLSPGDPQGNLAALAQLLRPYLMQRGELLDFYHGQFQEAVITSYLPSESQRLAAHDQLATYFRDKADPERNQSWKADCPRPLSELPFHLTQSENWTDLIGSADKPGVLTDLSFIEAKCTAGLVHDLVADYNATFTALPEFREERERLRLRDDAMFRYNRALKDYVIQRSDWQDLKNTPEPIHPPLPPELKTEKDFEIPERRFDRSARLRHFSNFINARIAPLISNSHGTLPLAYNLAENGSVVADAEKSIALRTEPWLRRSPRPPAIPFRPQCLRTLEGHKAGVDSVCVSPDGLRIISGSADRTLRVWDMETGACLHTLEGHNAGVDSVCVSPDGLRVISASWDKTIRVWDLESGTCLKTREVHGDEVSVSPDGRCAFSQVMSMSFGRPDGRRTRSLWDRTVQIWDLETGTCLRTLKGHGSNVESVRVSLDGRLAISGDSHGTILVWDMGDGACLHILKSRTNAVDISLDGRLAISGGGDKTLRVLDLKTGTCLRTLGGHSESITSVSFSPDGRCAISASWDKTIRVWNLESGDCLQVLKGHGDSVTSASFSPDGRRIISGSADRTLRIWDLESGDCLQDLDGHGGAVTSVNFSPDGHRAVSGSEDMTMRVWDIKTGSCLYRFEDRFFMVRLGIGDTRVSVSPDGRRTISGYSSTVQLWDVESGSCLQTFEGHSSHVNCVSFSPDGRCAISASWDKTIRVWNLESGACLRTLQTHNDEIISVSISPDGHRAISIGRHAISSYLYSVDKTLQVWDVESGFCIQVLKGHSDAVTCVSFSPDGRRIISGSEDMTMRVWDLETGACLHTLKGHSEGVHSVIVSPDGRHAISGSKDNTLRVWDMNTGDCLAIYNSGSAVCSTTFAPSTGRIVCGTSDGQMHFLTPVNFPPSGPAILTAANPQKARCPVCGQEFAPPPAVVAAIQDQTAVAVQQSSLSIQHSALLSSCPHCQQPLQFNPFFVSAP